MTKHDAPDTYDHWNPKRFKEALAKPDLGGLVNPLLDPPPPLLDSTHPIPSPETVSYEPLRAVWVRMAGYKPAWTPAIISYILPRSVTINRYFVFFIDGPSFDSALPFQSPNTSSVTPRWVVEEQGCRLWRPEDRQPANVKYTWISDANLKPWEGLHRESFLKAIKGLDGRKRKQLTDAVASGDRINADPSSVPALVVRDSKYRASVQAHSDQVAVDLVNVRPALKLHHLKLFLEANMIELHWRTIAYARQFVKAIPDEIFGGFHLIAAQDWPRDRDVDSGAASEVFLAYPGAILDEAEAIALESSCKNGIHEDRNRYVAEIPNTAEILDKSGSYNVNCTGRNLFVDGLKYADPTSPVWAPGPTVNHERTQYCKLAPHHVSGGESIRGFWLQRKRGEIITKGEPLFWSYDGGAGKFDADFGLKSAPPPTGWISTKEILEIENAPSRVA